MLYVVNDTVMSVDLSKSALEPAKPKRLFKLQGWNDAPNWDATADGQQFVFAVSPPGEGAPSPEPFTVILNWQAMLKH